jgi:hypothetical protein
VNNWKVILATAVIFGAGVVTGGLLVNYVQQHGAKGTRSKSPSTTARLNVLPPGSEDVKLSKTPEILSKQFLQQLDETLRLTSEQRAFIQKAINERQNQIRRTLQDARLEIREVLTPGQMVQFDELVKRPMLRRGNSTNNPAVPLITPAAVPTNTP